MKKLYIALFSFLAFGDFVIAQCPPPGTPTSTNTCIEAQANCLNLDGYCGTINNNNVQQPFPGCPNNVLNNDEWFAFYAGTTNIAIQITPSNCQAGGQQGLQGAIYQACGPPWVAMDLQCPCTTNPFTLNSSNFVVGQIYYIVIDGCGGNVCDYSVQVTQGSTVGQPPANPGPITGPTTACVNSNTAYSIASVTGATSYQWTMNPVLGTTNNSTTNTTNITWSTPGTTQLCVTAENECFVNQNPSCTTITVVPIPTATLSGTGTLCEGPTGTVPLTVNFTPTGGGPWTFVYAIGGVNQPPITTSDNPYTINATQPGNYTLVSVNYPSPNCPGTVSGSSNITIAAINETANITPDVCGQGLGDIDLNVTPAGTYTYAWSNGASTQDLTDVASGNYVVTITNSQGCTETASYNVGNNSVNINISGTTTPNTICNGDEGDINITVTPAGNTYTYNWSNGSTMEDLTNVPAGSYTVTVSFGTTCSATASYTIANQPNTPNISSTTTPSLCELANGDINVSVSGGVSPYTFAWSNGETTEDLNDVLAGSYTVTVTGANGCTSTSTISLTNNNPAITLTGAVTANTTCNGGNGGINLTVTPSAPPAGGTYIFSWSTGDMTEDISNVPTGNYTVTVSGGGACTATANFQVPNQPNTPNISAAPVASICGLANGDINLTVSGGVAPYTYAWSNGETIEDLNDVLSGTYTVTVTGANGCTSTSSINLPNNNPAITITGTTAPNTTCSGGNGNINITIAPSAPPAGGTYTINWSTGDTGTSLVGLTPGTYTVTVDGGGACTQTASFTINNQPNTPNITAQVTPDFCNQNTGGASLTVSGGVAPFTYQWSNGSTDPSISGVGSGGYSVTVTGANGCTGTIPVNIPNNNVAITITPTITANTVCVGPGDGAISLVVQPGGLNITWSTGATGTSILSPLDPGTYSVTVSAGGTCTQEASFTVPTQPNVPILVTTNMPANCGLPNGEAEVQASGGAPGYTYQWSNGGTNPLISPVPTGNYTVTVTGANGCTSTTSVNVPDVLIPVNIYPTIVDNTSCILGNGSIDLVVDPPTAGVLWSNGSTSTSISNLNPGTYSVFVSAGGNCSANATYTVQDASNIPFLSYDVVNTTCGLSNGSIDLLINSGEAPFFISWSNGSPLEDLTNIPSGLYNVTVTSFTGCVATTAINVPNVNSTFTLSGAPAANTSCSSPNGGVNLTVTPAGTYTYAWSNTATTEDISNVPAGTYTVTVSAGGTCTAVGTYQVTNNASPPSLSTTPTAATCGLSNGSVNLTITGGVSPYTISWSNTATTEDLANIAGGTYTVTVTGANGCSATASANVGNTNTSPNVAGTTVANTSCISNNGAIDITVTPAGGYTYSWSNTASTEDLSNIAPGTYTVTVSAGGSCTSTASFTVANNSSTPAITNIITPAICSQNNGGIDISVTGATPPYTYAWSNMATTEDITNVLPGNYTVTVSGVNGCSSTASYNVPNNSSTFSLSGVAQPLSSCVTNNGSVNLTITPAGTYGIEWSNMAITEDINNLTPGTYTVTVTESGSCSATASFVVGDVTEDPTLSQSITPEVCDLLDGAVNLTVTGSTTPYTFAWSNTASSEDLVNIAGGTYTVTVTGANGCSSTTSANVPSNTIAFSVNGVTAANTSCDINNGAVDVTVSPAGSYVYTWSNTATTEDLTGLTGGSYSVTVSAGGSCTAVADFTVGSTTLDPVISSSLTAAICGTNTGGIDLTISGGVSPFTFEWASGPTSEDLTNVSPGNYSVEVTGANGCVSAANFTVQDSPVAISVNGTPSANTSCASPNGLVNITVTPAGTYNYSWSNMDTGEDIANLTPGTYTVTVSQGLTCSATASFTVGNTTPTPILTETINPDICAGSVGGINLTVTGNSAPYSYIWSNGAITEDLNNIVENTYTVTVTGSDGCSATASYDVPNTSNTFSFTGTPTANTLCGSGNGMVNITVTPAGTYNFIWSNGAITEDISGLLPGTYEVTVSDNGTCTASQVFTVGNNSPAPSVTGTPTNILCFGSSTGAINLTVTGGVGPYSFDWSPGIPGNPEDPTGLNAGTYSVTVTAASGCTGTASFNLTQPASATQLACAQSNNVSLPGMMDGEATVTIVGGTPPYTVDWNPGGQQGGVAAGPFVISNLGEGPYSVLVTDANGCPTNCGFNMSTNDCVTAVGSMSNTLLTNCGTGCITANYSNFGAYLDTNDVLQYILHIGTSNQIVGEIMRSSTPTFCFDPALMSYGVTYYISAAAGDNDGSGNVLLTDACTQVSIGTPIIFYAVPVATIAQPSPLTCLVQQTTVQGSSSLPGSTYLWAASGGGNIVGSTTNANINVNAAGTYTLTVTRNGCSSTASVQVIDLETTVTASVVSSPGEILDCTVSQITLSASAQGTNNANYTWFLNGQQVGTGQDYVLQDSGLYVVVVTDQASGCTGTASIGIDDNSDYPQLSVNPAPLLNCGDTVVTISGGSTVNGVTFEWVTINGTDTTLIGQGASTQVTDPGTYYLIGTAPNGCNNGVALQVNGDYTQPTANAGSNATLDCYQTPLNLNGGGSLGVSFFWTTGIPGVVISDPTNPVITVDAAGIYSLTVTNLGNHCTDTDDVEVFQYENVPQADITAEDPDCFGDENGSITLDTDPANGPYTFQLNGENYGSQNYFAPLAPGTYQIQVTDGQGCVWNTEVTLNNPEELVVNLGADLLVNLGETATILAQYTVPASQLDTLIWTPATLFPCPEMPCDEQEFLPTQQTVVTVTVIDEHGCRDEDLLTVFVKKNNPVYVPNSFSPNGDGTNDVFMIYAGKEVERIKEFLVFSRWGETVYQYFDFEPNNPAYGWDGTHRGEQLNPAVFAWFAVVEFKDGTEVLLEGDVSLLR